MSNDDNIKMSLTVMSVVFRNGTKQTYKNIYEFDFKDGLLTFSDKDFKTFVIALDKVEKFNISSVFI